jgi:hypothetical protein
MHHSNCPSSSRDRASWRAAGRILLVTGLLGAAVVTSPAAAHAEETVDECVEAAWAEYNRCLVTSSWWTSRLCDFSFVGRYLGCLQIEM